MRGASAAATSLASVREAARRIPWVRDASVRRRFPDAIEVRFQTHEPLARWADGGLVSVRGELFSAEHPGFLPMFRGTSTSVALMAQQYPLISKALSPLGVAVTEVRLSARGAWHVVLDSGLALELGREDIVARIERFVAAWPRLAAGAAGAKVADLRYSNGFAMATGERVKRK